MTSIDSPPNPNILHPIPGQDRVVLLKPLITNPLIMVGDFTYYDDPVDATAFESKNVLHHYGPERLVIGRFCAIAAGVQFIMNGANHRMNGPSTYPFPIMGGSWSQHIDLVTDLPNRGDTVVGNDVWIGGNVTVMPGIRIGNGAIISTGSIVTKDVPDYGIVGGNPATLIRHRFTAPQIQQLLNAAWWDWPLAMITEHVRTIADGTVEDITAIANHAQR
ncbi:CatB-related O-acetyltransferase [Arthrobacter sp. GMC3]|uniref:CatB-related O-acetyltransferase n=1 Tax=Arthrobacter sp. GMC3 TaxID=2058894 RepID=UPI002157FE4C|nr:CatB-related O-acetyltransferase [Arthrobacter sp. GMC3]